MRTIAQQRTKLRQLLSDLPVLAEELVQDAAETSVALRKEDSIERGINKDGADGKKVQYSTNPVPTYYFKGKELNQGGREYTKKNKTGTWYGLRQSEGLRSTVVNLTHSGDMWKAYGVLLVRVTDGHAVARVGLSGPSAEVFANNVKRYGKFFRNTPAELQRFRADIQEASHTWLKSYLA